MRLAELHALDGIGTARDRLATVAHHDGARRWLLVANAPSKRCPPRGECLAPVCSHLQDNVAARDGLACSPPPELRLSDQRRSRKDQCPARRLRARAELGSETPTNKGRGEIGHYMARLAV